MRMIFMSLHTSSWRTWKLFKYLVGSTTLEQYWKINDQLLGSLHSTNLIACRHHIHSLRAITVGEKRVSTPETSTNSKHVSSKSWLLDPPLFTPWRRKPSVACCHKKALYPDSIENYTLLTIISSRFLVYCRKWMFLWHCLNHSVTLAVGDW